MHETFSRGTTRRVFLRSGALAAGAAFFPALAPRSRGAVSPNDRIGMGAIGIGGRGEYVLGAFLREPDVRMVAVCDVQGERMARAKNQVDAFYGNSDCESYRNLQDLLARDDIDAVVIATGDNWHALASCLAARAGKDIYCEKPLSITIAESRAVSDTVSRYGRIFQCGTQRRNLGNFTFAAHLAQSGKLGRLHTLHAEKAGQVSGVSFPVLPPQPEPDPEVMDWDGWLGPATWRPYNAQYHERGFWAGHGDFSGGPITEWGSHTVDLCQWANDADDTSPVHYETINDNLDVMGRYANGVKLVIRTGLRFGTCPVRFEGDEGWVETGDSGTLECFPASLLENRRFRGGYPADSHIREFLDCVKSRTQPASTAEASHRSISACHAANICVRLGRAVEWDPRQEAFMNDPEADRLRSRAYRQPWRL